MGIMAAGIILSELTGAIIGICCRNQMSATSVAVPAMMIFSFLPMLSMFNENIEKFARIAYSQQLSYLMDGIGGNNINAGNIMILAVNAVIAVAVFVYSFSKKGLEG